MKSLLFAAMLSLVSACASANERWTVYYGHTLPAESFASFDMVVLDATYDAPVAALKAQGKTVLGYLSLGEAENYRPYYKKLKAKKLLLEANPEWKGHYIIDIRNPQWGKIVAEELIPEILAKGFDGIMFDTIDSPLHLAIQKKDKYQGMNEAAVKLLCDIRGAHPNVTLMLNRGFDVLTQAAPCIDMLLAESTRTDLQLSGKKKPKLLSEEDYRWYVSKMKEAQAIAPALKIYSLDYWPIKDMEGVAKIYAEQRANGFIPYVSTIDLQQVYTEPN
ncbi:MAG: endo alpha-1,4 polygalactosaminidase [Alphaproteobacteria bacterium]